MGAKEVVALVVLLFSLLAFSVGSAAFHGALALTIFSTPIALVTLMLGAWRLSSLAIYFGGMAWLSLPLSNYLQWRIDYILLFSFFVGCVLGAIFYANYRRTVSAT